MNKTLKIEDLKEFGLYTKATLIRLLNEATVQIQTISEIRDVIQYTLDNFNNISIKKKPIPINAISKGEKNYPSVAEFLKFHISDALDFAEQHNVNYTITECKKIYDLYNEHNTGFKVSKNNFGRILTTYCIKNDIKVDKIVKANENNKSQRFYKFSKKEQNNQ